MQNSGCNQHIEMPLLRICEVATPLLFDPCRKAFNVPKSIPGVGTFFLLLLPIPQYETAKDSHLLGRSHLVTLAIVATLFKRRETSQAREEGVCYRRRRFTSADLSSCSSPVLKHKTRSDEAASTLYCANNTRAINTGAGYPTHSHYIA